MHVPSFVIEFLLDLICHYYPPQSSVFKAVINTSILLRRYIKMYTLFILAFFTIVEHYYTVITEEPPLDTSDNQNTEIYTLPTLSRHSGGSFIEIGT